MFMAATLSKSVSNKSHNRSPRLRPSKIALCNQASLCRKQAFLQQETGNRPGDSNPHGSPRPPERTKWLFWQLLTPEITELSSQSVEQFTMSSTSWQQIFGSMYALIQLCQREVAIASLQELQGQRLLCSSFMTRTFQLLPPWPDSTSRSHLPFDFSLGQASPRLQN